jgi:hypothetical protein
MKHILSISILFLLFALTTNAFSQTGEIVITEGSTIEICGRTVAIEGLWIDNFELKADISVYYQKNSKPVTGGYKSGDTIFISDVCKHRIKSILKFGLNSKGKVVLSNHIKLYIGDVRGGFMMTQSKKYYFGDGDWEIKKVFKDSAEIYSWENGVTLNTFILKHDDIVWTGKYAYSISRFIESDDDEPDSGGIVFKLIKDLSYINRDSDPEEMLNPPVHLLAGNTELIIRKMKLYPKKRIDEEELKNTPVKFWVLKIFYYPRGIASMVIEVERNGEKLMVEFEGYKSFDTVEEVMEFARVNKITDIKLE